LKRYELESFLKSFFIFFILLEILLAINFWHEYQVKKTEVEEKIHVEMKLCAYTIQCEGLQTDFVDKDKDKEENILYKSGDFYSYFQVPTVEKYLMKVTYPRAEYLQRVARLEKMIEYKFMLYSFFSALVSLLFAIYALTPLRKALHLNEEFVKDILHDFNTPISSMKINLSLFKREIGENPKIQRLENNIESILSLQNNLQVFLKDIPTQTEAFELDLLVGNRIGYFMTLYPDISYQSTIESVTLKCNKDAFARILDNLLSNAGKYNKAQGRVLITVKDNILSIADTGKGIKHPQKIFRRYYKEQDRGIGIGLHIVQKLCVELGIDIKVESSVQKGTTVLLDISHVMQRV
jgi:signal transduction histidine kinase